jgi:hypothetical protein
LGNRNRSALRLHARNGSPIAEFVHLYDGAKKWTERGLSDAAF